MEHADLIEEMGYVEHMSTQERLLLARRRRMQQLKVWSQRDKEWSRQHRTTDKTSDNKRPHKRHIIFSDNVMLLEAASRNDIDEVRRLLIKGVSPNATNEDGLTALHQCCIDDNEEMMKLLIEFGANVNAEDSEKWTPLHAAATCGHLHLVRYLIISGANLLAVNADGNMPYDICEDEAALDYIENEMARRGVTQELIDETRASTETRMLRDLQLAAVQSYDLEICDEQGATPLHIAAANGYIRVVEFLLDQHVCTDVKDIDDWQPVHAAACWGHLDVLELLVQNGADLNARTKHDETPADICEDPELRERIMQLRTEQESKRLQEAQRRRVKRTQSNNTRTQSVRRTSIRDKTLTTKKDAVEEARLRLQAQDVNMTGIGKMSESEVDSSLEYNNNNSISNNDAFEKYNDDRRIQDSCSISRREPEGKDNDSIVASSLTNDANNKLLPLDLPTETSYSTESNGKINIHVSVTINASTLAELKKQRAQHRHSSPDVSIAQALQQSPTSLASDKESLELEQVLAPVKRFAGNTGTDIVIGDPRNSRCCTLL